jgi:acyl carrier protein
MPDATSRLIRCFSAVFPAVSADQICAADVQSLPGWDSLTMVTLASVLEEEFGVEIDFADFPECISFTTVHDYLQHRGSAS